MRFNAVAMLIAAALTALLSGGCNPNPPEKAAPAANVPQGPARISQEGPYRFSLMMEPMPPKNLTKTTFTLMALTSKGQGLSGATVTLELKMDHPMTPNLVTLKEQSPGTYRGEGVFTMGGNWEAVVTAKKGDETGTARYAISNVSFAK